MFVKVFEKRKLKKTINAYSKKNISLSFRMVEAGISCPHVLGLRKHILIMEFIGKDQVPAPKLKDACLSKVQMEGAYLEVINVGVQIIKFVLFVLFKLTLLM